MKYSPHAHSAARKSALIGISKGKMAAPHVAGVVALVSTQLIKEKGFADPTSVLNILQSTARDRGTTGVDMYYG